MRMGTAVMLLFVVHVHPAGVEEWSRFRGPGGSGVLESANLPVEVGTDRSVRWRVALPLRVFSRLRPDRLLRRRSRAVATAPGPFPELPGHGQLSRPRGRHARPRLRPGLGLLPRPVGQGVGPGAAPPRPLRPVVLLTHGLPSATATATVVSPPGRCRFPHCSTGTGTASSSRPSTSRSGVRHRLPIPCWRSAWGSVET